VGATQWDDEDDEDDEDNHIVVRNRRIRQQWGERWDEMEDMMTTRTTRGRTARRTTARRMWWRANGNLRCPRSGRLFLST